MFMAEIKQRSGWRANSRENLEMFTMFNTKPSLHCAMDSFYSSFLFGCLLRTARTTEDAHALLII